MKFKQIGVVAALLFCACVGALALDTPAPAVYSDSKIQALIKDLGNEDFEKRQSAEKELMKAGAKALEPLKAAQNSTDPQVKATAARLSGRLRFASLGAVNYLDIFPGDSVLAIWVKDIGGSAENAKKSAIGKLIASPAMAPFREKIDAKMNENADARKQLEFWLTRFNGQAGAAVWEINLQAGPAGIKAAAIAEITDADPRGVVDAFLKETHLIADTAQKIYYKEAEIQENAPGQGAMALLGRHLLLGPSAECLKPLIDGLLTPAGLNANPAFVKLKQSLGAHPEFIFALDFKAYMKTLNTLFVAMNQPEQVANFKTLMDSAGASMSWMAISSATSGLTFEDRYVIVMDAPPKGLAAAGIPPADAEPQVKGMALVPSNAVLAAVSYVDGTKMQAGLSNYLSSFSKMMAATPGNKEVADVLSKVEAFETKAGFKLADLGACVKGQIAYWAVLPPNAALVLPDLGMFVTCVDADKAKTYSDILRKALNTAADIATNKAGNGAAIKETPSGTHTIYQVDWTALGAQLPPNITYVLCWAVEGNRVFFGSSVQALQKQLSFLDTKIPGLLTQPAFIKALATAAPEELKGQIAYGDMRKLLSFAQTAGLPLIQAQIPDEQLKLALAALPPADELLKDIPPVLITSATQGQLAQSVMRAPLPPLPTLFLGIMLSVLRAQQMGRAPMNQPPGNF